MKYQSELIKEIVESRGHEKSSSHYESECIETWIEEAKGAYPKLCDYEGEWLNYISILDGTGGEFPYETITDVTEATIDNVVPYAYKSAILSGKTKLLDSLNNEVNEPNYPNIIQGYYIDVSTGKIMSASSSCITEHFIECPNIPFKIRGDNRYKRIVFYDENKTFISGKEWTAHANADQPVASSIPENAKYIKISFSISVDDTIAYTPSTKIELLDNDENNLYLTRLESVKMPVLTTTGKNTFNIKNAGVSKAGWYSIPLESSFTGEIYIKVAESLPSDFRVNIFVNNYTENRLSNSQIKDGYTGEFKNVSSIGFHSPSLSIMEESRGNLDDLIANGNIVIELGGEPYKSNILTVNDDVTLRGIGDVKDELDCLTGEVVERIGEIVLDGSENWNSDTELTNTCKFILKIDDMVYYNWKTTISKPPFVKSSTFRSLDLRTEQHNLDIEHLTGIDVGRIALNISKERLSEISVDALKFWLSQNPITVQHLLKTESIKTVDLLVQNQDGKTLSEIKPIEGTMHLSTSSDTINPLFSGEIPVESITQNLASFIDLETEE